MSQDVKLNGKTYLGVPYTTLPKASGGSAKFMDTTDATASAASILSGYTAYVNGEKVTGEASGTPTVLTTKSITTNGKYDAEDDNADGYSEVTVNVTPTRYVHGTFTPSTSEKGVAKSITLPYTGSGYPIACVVYPTTGTYKSGSDIYTLVQKQVILWFSMVKANVDAAPDYIDSTEKNLASAVAMYKYSDSDATSYASTGSKDVRAFNQNSAAASNVNCVRFSSATSMNVFVADTAYGFAPEIEYTYEIVYSS